MKNRRTLATRALSAALLALLAGSVHGFAAPGNAPPPDRFLALHIAQNDAATGQMLYRYGVPFLSTPSRPATKDVIQANVGVTVKKIFLLGLIETQRPSAWSSPLTYAARYIVGDNLGAIRLHYADGSTQDYPLILGESVWWGLPFYQTREPFPTDARLRKAFEQSLRLYPAAPVDDGNYVAVIAPRNSPLASIEITYSPEKHGSVAVAGITVEVAPDARIPGSLPIDAGELTPEFRKFVAGKTPARRRCRRRRFQKTPHRSQRRLLFHRRAISSRPSRPKSPPDTPGRVSSSRAITTPSRCKMRFTPTSRTCSTRSTPMAPITPPRATRSPGPAIRGRLAGNSALSAKMLASITAMHGRATSAAPCRSSPSSASSTRPRPPRISLSVPRVPGRRIPALTYKGVQLPPHWNRVINRPDFAQPFENDGHGLIALFIYKLWQRVPDRDAWLRARWPDVKAAGDWIPWQFDHADVTGAKDGVLYTTGESAAGKGYSVYPDAVCMTALEALAQMADSIGETQSATLWRDRAEKMRAAISANYAITDPKYGRVWTLDYAGWPNQSTVLGPLIFLADYHGFAPQDDDPAWRPVNEAAYQRLIDTYRPFGFYGWAMGYGQGFVTQAALLLDRMKDVTPMLNWTARETYDAEIHSFVVPEGVQVDARRPLHLPHRRSGQRRAGSGDRQNLPPPHRRG